LRIWKNWCRGHAAFCDSFGTFFVSPKMAMSAKLRNFQEQECPKTPKSYPRKHFWTKLETPRRKTKVKNTKREAKNKCFMSHFGNENQKA
jgi:hypothetical protein